MRLSLFVLVFTLFFALAIANVVVITKGNTEVNQYFAFTTIALNIIGGMFAIFVVCYCVYALDFHAKVHDITIYQWEKGCSSSAECVKRIIEGCAKSESCSL